MRVYLVVSKESNFVLMAYESQTRAELYAEGLNLSRAERGLAEPYYVSSVYMITEI